MQEVIHTESRGRKEPGFCYHHYFQLIPFPQISEAFHGGMGWLGLLDKAVPKEIRMDGRCFLGTFCPFIVVSIW